MAFQKGNKLGKGRPEGSKNKSFLDVSHWLSRADAEVELEQDPEKRISIIKWATELIMPKVQSLPATPGDSLSNALESQALIKALEHDAANAESVTAGD
jgi:hypothetical protein